MSFQYQVSPYKITFKDSLKGKQYFKEGFLVKCKDAENRLGYSDYCNLNLTAFKNVLNEKKTFNPDQLDSIQAKQSIQFSIQDLNRQKQEEQTQKKEQTKQKEQTQKKEQTKQKEQIFSNNFSTNNHYLISDPSSFSFSQLKDLWLQDYRSLKIKITEDLTEDLNSSKIFFLNLAKNTKQPFLLRLDFNSNISLKKLHLFLDNLTNILKNSSLKVEFLEDPLPYDYKNWLQLYDKYQYPLAIDLEWSNFCLQEHHFNNLKKPLTSTGKTLVFSFIILKPAVQDVYSVVKAYGNENIKFVLTHYMDHGLGRIFSLICLDDLISIYGEKIFLNAGLNTFPVQGDGVDWSKYFTSGSSTLKLKQPLYSLTDIFNPDLLKWRDL